jgi:hypothetical protein
MSHRAIRGHNNANTENNVKLSYLETGSMPGQVWGHPSRQCMTRLALVSQVLGAALVYLVSACLLSFQMIFFHFNKI